MKQGRRSLGLLVAAAMLSATACLDEVPYPRETVLPAVLKHYNDSLRVELPDSVTAGQAFQFRVYSYGGGCERFSGTPFTNDAARATVRPERVVQQISADQACTDELRLFRHEVLLTFTAPGPATIRLIGDAKPAGTVDTTFTVVVR